MENDHLRVVSLQNMAELHEATLQSQSVQTYPNIISKAWNQLSYLQHLNILNWCTDQTIPCSLQAVYPLMSDIIGFRAQDQSNPLSMRAKWWPCYGECPHFAFWWCITIGHSYETTIPLDGACKSLGLMISGAESFCKPVVSGRTSSWWFWWCICSCGRCTWLPKTEAP